METASSHPQHKPRPLQDLVLSIVIPSVILMKFSGDDSLGTVNALLLALAFPLGWGIFELVRYRKFNFIALLGLVSVLLTGGIGLLELNAKWLAVKEAAIPGIIGLVVLVMARTKYPLIRTLIYNPKIMQVDRVHEVLEARGLVEQFEARLMNANYLLSGTFFFSAAMNYILATIIVTSPSGTAEFNEQLGQLTLVSYPVIAIPSTLMMFGIIYYLWKTVHGLTGLKLEELVVHHDQ